VPLKVSAALRGEGSVLRDVVIPTGTSMFLHGGWLHLLGNVWFLFIFGDNVEGRLGHGTFLLFYLACGVAASAAQYALSPRSDLPMIGASGAVAGVLGAYAVCWPRARILTLVPVFVLVTFIELPALFVLGFWFVVQLLAGALAIGVPFAHGGVAYWAHVGGFVAGALLVRLLPRRRPVRPRSRRGRGRRW
jgi:membrane associated rhomboid family serine protease